MKLQIHARGSGTGSNLGTYPAIHAHGERRECLTSNFDCEFLPLYISAQHFARPVLIVLATATDLPEIILTPREHLRSTKNVILGTSELARLYK